MDGKPVESGDWDYVYELLPDSHRITMQLRGGGPQGQAKFEHAFLPGRRYGFAVMEIRGDNGRIERWEAHLADYDTDELLAEAQP